MARRWLATVLIVLLLVSSIAADSSAASVPSAGHVATSAVSASPVATAEAAVQETVQVAGATYAGDCAATTPANYGQVCSKYVASQGNVSAYMTGRVFSEFDTWVFVGQTSAGWIPLSVVPLDGSATTLSVPWPSG